MSASRPLAVLLLGSLLAACAPGSPPAPEETQPAPAPPVATGPDAKPDAAPSAADTEAWTDPATLPTTRHLDVTVEGQRESVEARLFTSPQGYALHVLPQFAMTPEEPCCDLAWARVDDGFFMRIERIDPAQDLATLRANMELALSSVGPAETQPPPAYADLGADVDVELAMRASGDAVGMVMLVARIDGGRYRVTLHLPHREAVEGIEPGMWAMLGSVRTTGPRGQG